MKTFTDEEREAIRVKCGECVQALTELWDRERELEQLLGHDVDGLTDYFQDAAAGDAIELDDEALDAFLEYAHENRG